MSRKQDNTPGGRRAAEIADGLFRKGHVLRGHDNQRGANEGLDERAIHELERENGRPYGLEQASGSIKLRAEGKGGDGRGLSQKGIFS
jgi:hypothetical protein